MIKFGTDGWRAVISDEFTFENVRIASQAIADYVNKKSGKGKAKMAVGYDTRFLSDEYAAAAAEVLAANDVEIILVDKPTPTPVISFTVLKKGLDGGVMITASHNPYRFNGVKFKADFGGSPDPEITDNIEKNLYKRKPKSMPLAQAVKEKRVKVISPEKPYIRFLKSYVDFKKIAGRGFKVLVNPMFGASSGYLEEVMKGSKTKLTSINSERDVLFGGLNPEPVEKNLKSMAGIIKKGKFDLGLVFDGDGDRIGAMRPDGVFITPHQIFALLLFHLVENKKWSGEVVKTISSTALIGKITEKYALKLHETPVGFKHIVKLMRHRDVLIGGEESGGIGFKNYIPERDGPLCGLLLLEMLACGKKGIIPVMKEMEKEFGSFVYLREDVHYPDKLKKRLVPCLRKCPPAALAGEKIIEIKDYDGIKFIARDDSWLLLRLSGTEPILRIYAEAKSKKKVLELIKLGKKIAFEV